MSRAGRGVKTTEKFRRITFHHQAFLGAFAAELLIGLSNDAARRRRTHRLSTIELAIDVWSAAQAVHLALQVDAHEGALIAV